MNRREATCGVELCGRRFILDGDWPSPDWDAPGIYVRACCIFCQRVSSVLLGPEYAGASLSDLPLGTFALTGPEQLVNAEAALHAAQERFGIKPKGGNN